MSTAITSIVCDWFAPHDDYTPLVLVVTHDAGILWRGFDYHPELWSAFYAMFSGEIDVDPDGCVSDYVYEACAMNVDVSPFMERGSALFLRVALDQ